MTDILIAFPLGFFYFIVVIASGFWISRYFCFLQENILLRFGFAITFGLALLGYTWSILAAIPHAMQTITIFILLTTFMILSRRSFLTIRNDGQFIIKNIGAVFWPTEKSLRWVAIPLVLYLLMAVPLAFHPMGTDALAFYFAQAKLIAYAHQFVPLSGYESFSQIPLPAELSYSALILMGSEWAARFMTTFQLWACALLMAGCVYHFNQNHIRRAWLAVLLLLTSTGVTLLVSDGKTDLYGAMLGFAACYISLVMPLNSRRNMMLLGITVGLSFTAKLSYIPILVPMIGFIIFVRLWREKNFKEAVLHSLMLGLIIAPCIIAAFVPNMAKNFMAYGEPLAPFFFFNPHYYPPFLNQSWFSPEVTEYILSIYPIAWTFGQFPMQHGNLSPYVWATLPMLFLVRWKKTSFGALLDNKSVLFAFAGGLGMLSWAVFYSSVIAPRYIFPALFAFIPLAAVGLDRLWEFVRPQRIAHFVLIGIISMSAILVVVNDLPSVKRSAKHILQGPQETQLRHLDYAAKEAETALPADGRLFLAAWERALFEPQTMNCMINVHEQKVLGSILDSSKYWQTLYDFGTRVVLVNKAARNDVFTILDSGQKPYWLGIEAKTLSNDYIMYVMVPNSDAPPPKWACRETRKNYYEPVNIE